METSTTHGMEKTGRAMGRRQFIKLAMLGLGGAASAGVLARFALPVVMNAIVSRRLIITEALAQMVDLSYVYMYAFEDADGSQHKPAIPGPLLEAIEGDEIELSITNSLKGPHGFRVLGMPGEAGRGIELEPGETRRIRFAAPQGGTYAYFDHMNEPVNRVLGLYGALLVLPRKGNTPYSNPTPMIQQLFDDLGKAEHFPGEPWKKERTKTWIINAIDRDFNDMAERGERIDGRSMLSRFVPDYFTNNGLSGFYADHEPSIVAKGHIGHPHVIHLLNVGLIWASIHMHGNHFYILSKVDDDFMNRLQENVIYADTVTLKPLERIDWLHAFIRPPDIAGDPKKPLRELLKEEFKLQFGGVPMSPQTFATHDHNEQSNTSTGGNYPQGLHWKWEITGDVDGVEFPKEGFEEVGKSGMGVP